MAHCAHLLRLMVALLLTIIPMEVTPATLPALRPTRSICLYQFSLAAQTCALLPPQRGLIGNLQGTNETSHHVEKPEEVHKAHHERSHHRRHQQHHGSHSNRRSHSHRRSHGHRHRHHHNVVQSQCCKWLTQMDSACVCDVLRHLPLFLTRPEHTYTVQVEDYCQVKFTCDALL